MRFFNWLRRIFRKRSFITYAIPLVRKQFPRLIAKDLVSVQPMTGSSLSNLFAITASVSTLPGELFFNICTGFGGRYGWRLWDGKKDIYKEDLTDDEWYDLLKRYHKVEEFECLDRKIKYRRK